MWRKPKDEGKERKEKKVVKADEKRMNKNARKLFQKDQKEAIADWIRVVRGCEEPRGSPKWFGYWKGAEKDVWDGLDPEELKRYKEEAKRREEKPTVEEKRE